MSTSIVVGALGYVVIQVLKGKMSPAFLVPLIAVTLILFLGSFPRLIKRIDDVKRENGTKPG